MTWMIRLAGYTRALYQSNSHGQGVSRFLRHHAFVTERYLSVSMDIER